MSEELRVGTGFDAHAFADGRPLVLAGVTIPHTRGLVGHSDADLVSHAVTDALLGAAGGGDIGELYPSDDPSLAGASSIDLHEADPERFDVHGTSPAYWRTRGAQGYREVYDVLHPRQQNEQLRGSVDQLADDQRIERLAGAMGLVLPPPGAVGYLATRPGGDVSAALGNIHAPDAAGFLAMTPRNGALVTGQGASTLPPTPGAPAPPAPATSAALTPATSSASPTTTPTVTTPTVTTPTATTSGGG